MTDVVVDVVVTKNLIYGQKYMEKTDNNENLFATTLIVGEYPDLRCLDGDGHVKVETEEAIFYFYNSQLHRDGGPAIVWKVLNKDIYPEQHTLEKYGLKTGEEWFKHGVRHRDDGGPARISQLEYHWYIDGNWQMFQVNNRNNLILSVEGMKGLQFTN
jgi:hypothetical protein